MVVAMWGQNYHCKDELLLLLFTDVALLDFVDFSFAKVVVIVASQLLTSAILEMNAGRTFQCCATSYFLCFHSLGAKKLRGCPRHSSRRFTQFGSASESAVL